MANSMSIFDDIDETDDGFQEGVTFPVFKQKDTWCDVFVNKDLQTLIHPKC